MIYCIWGCIGLGVAAFILYHKLESNTAPATPTATKSDIEIVTHTGAKITKIVDRTTATCYHIAFNFNNAKCSYTTVVGCRRFGGTLSVNGVSFMWDKDWSAEMREAAAWAEDYILAHSVTKASDSMAQIQAALKGA